VDINKTENDGADDTKTENDNDDVDFLLYCIIPENIVCWYKGIFELFVLVFNLLITKVRFHRFCLTEEYSENDEDDIDEESAVLEMMMYYQHGRTNSSSAPKF